MTVSLLTRPLLDRAPPWVLPGAALDFDFVRQRYFQKGLPSNIEVLLTTSRASVGYVDYVNGIWRPIAANLPRISDKGLFVELGRTNDALWSRDMTNAAWVKVNMTAALTATGIDGVANSASTLTATAGNATILQTITLSSSADTYSVRLKRISGTGTINITENGGTNYTAAAVTSTWTQFQVTATLANPVFGIQIVTNGDSVAADFNQLEPGGYATSPILTTSATVTRAADAITVTKPVFQNALSLFVDFVPVSPVASAQQNLVVIDDGTANNRLVVLRSLNTGLIGLFVQGSGTNHQFYTSTVNNPNVAAISAFASGAADQAGLSSLSPVIGTWTNAQPSGLSFIRLSPLSSVPVGYLRRIAYFTSRVPNATLARFAGLPT